MVPLQSTQMLHLVVDQDAVRLRVRIDQCFIVSLIEASDSSDLVTKCGAYVGRVHEGMVYVWSRWFANALKSDHFKAAQPLHSTRVLLIRWSKARKDGTMLLTLVADPPLLSNLWFLSCTQTIMIC